MGGVVAAFEGAVGAVDAVEEVVEGGALRQVTNLVEGDGDRVHERHGVFQVEVGFTVEVEGAVPGLVDASIDGVKDGRSLNLVLGEIGEEEVEVALKVCLGCVLDNTVGIFLLAAAENRRDLVEGSETVGNDAFVAVGQITNQRFDIHVGPLFRQRGRARSAKPCCSAGDDFGSHFRSWTGTFDLGVGLISWRRQLGVEVHSGRDEVNVMANVFGHVVFRARYMRLTARMLVHVILGFQQTLGFAHGGIKLQPT